MPAALLRRRNSDNHANRTNHKLINRTGSRFHSSTLVDFIVSIACFYGPESSFVFVNIYICTFAFSMWFVWFEIYWYHIPLWLTCICGLTENGTPDVWRQADQFPGGREWRILLHWIRGKTIIFKIVSIKNKNLWWYFYNLFLFLSYFRSAITCDCSVVLCTNDIRACFAGPLQTMRGNV